MKGRKSFVSLARHVLCVKPNFVRLLFVPVSMFQVVRFPNDACDSDDNSKNGTCKLILYFIDFLHY